MSVAKEIVQLAASYDSYEAHISLCYGTDVCVFSI